MCFSLLVFNTAWAQGFVQFSGIAGEVTVEGYEGWSEFTAVTQEISRSEKTTGIVSQLSSLPAIQNLGIIKPLDKASLKIAERALKGMITDEVIIEWALSSDNGLKPYYSYLLKNVRVVSYNSRGISHSESNETANRRIEEEIALDFDEIVVRYWEYDSNGNNQGVTEYNWKKTSAPK